jgi:hypothetical protein
MTLRILDPNEDRNFAEGETIYDTDGNAFTVRDGHAVLNKHETAINRVTYSLASQEMRNCFSRTDPRASLLAKTRAVIAERQKSSR